MRSAGSVQMNRRSVLFTTLLLVLGAETVLFGTLVMSYLFLRSGGSGWHFTHPQAFDILIAGLNTLILLSSAFLARNGLLAIQKDRLKALQRDLLLALALGAVFVAGQVFEFNHSSMRIDDTSFGGVFFALISFHALHVLAGMTVLGLNYARARLGDFSDRKHEAVTAGTWFWYYVTAIWVVLFVVLYLI
jgi:cytochrome c oxidase subunit III